MPHRQLPDFPPLTLDELRSALDDIHWAVKFPPVLTIDQTAELLQVPKSTVYDWSSRGLLRGSA